ncbi:transcription initiation factor TFIID subunit 3 [Wyeomyia smithii]|uniref:transcription initiation factor TFIID subunit 3 n=1 Tax=Wyeomyia smithii TaxID=174621 RepID=UPI0024680CBA|nr:transcription initiation factor TFIID subunit 3 [Wyeomyia smithii]
MAERYTHQLLKVVVAQVCQTIGWHSIQTTPLELMMDILDQYMRDITRLTHRYAELYNRTDPNLDDVALAYREMGINLGDLQEYLQFVDPITRPFEVPKYPLPKDSHLNFLKPGSKEVLSRPVHIPEHMPPMLVDSEEELEEANRRQMRQAQLLEGEEAQQAVTSVPSEDVKPEMGDFVEKFEEVAAEEITIMETSQNQEELTFKRPPEFGVEGLTGEAVRKPRPLTEEGRPTREISSVIMTTSGFISPAREGKLPDSKVPEIPEEKPKPPPPPPPVPVALPIAKMDDKFSKKAKKKPLEKEKKKDKKVEKKKDGSEKEAASRPVTPAANVIEAPPPNREAEDVKPVLTAPEHTPKTPTPLPDVKPPEIQLPPSESEKVSIPVAAVKPFEKVKKEKVPRKKRQPAQAKLKQTTPPTMVLNPAAMDIGSLFPSPHSMQGQLSPLSNQITPPKLPKPKRTKVTKKQAQQQYLEQMQQFPAPLNAQSILEMFSPSPGKKPLPGMFQPSLFASPQQQLQQMTPQKQTFPDNSAQTQLDILQKLHPSLEITPSPGPSSTAGGPVLQNTSPEKHKLNIFKKVAKKDTSPGAPPVTNQGPIIIIDDDKSPPHQPQFPVTPMNKKRLPKSTAGNFPFQDTLSSPDLPFNISMNSAEHSGIGLMSSFSREFSPPKTPSNMPKTPDIKLQSSSSSSASWMSDSGKLSAGPGQLFGDFSNFGLPAPVKEEKKKRQRQKQPRATNPKKAKNAQLLNELSLLQQFQQQQQHQQPPVSAAGIDKKPLHDAVSSYTKLLNQAMPSGLLSSQVRNPMFGMFPLPSGPGLIPENPLFNPFPGQPSFFPTGPFGMPAIPPRFDIGNLLRYPRPPKPQTTADIYDNLDPETKLAHTPLDLQKSTCNVAPLVPPSLQIEPITSLSSKPNPSRRQMPKDRPSPIQHQPPPPPQEHSLNLSTKTTNICNPMPAQSVIQKFPMSKSIVPPTVPVSAPAVPHMLGSKMLDSNLPGIPPTTIIPAEPMQHSLPPTVITPALNQPLATVAPATASVAPIALGETIVIGSDSDTNSQSTVTMAAMGAGSGTDIGNKKDKSEKRKNKEHKKDKRLKEGKIKKKKDKKDKNKNRDRDRERPKSSHSLHSDVPMTDSAPVDTSSVPSDEPGLQEQLRRKEKKEKKKEKLKKEKRKAKERVSAAAALEGTGGYRSATLDTLAGASSIPVGTATMVSSLEPRDHGDGAVPKLMLKLGSSANPSPRSNTPDVPSMDLGGSMKEEKLEVKREASPELARISALVTRPPKSKTPGPKSKIKEEEGTKLTKSLDHSSKMGGMAEVATVKPRPRGIQPLPDSIDLFSVTPSHNLSTGPGFKSAQSHSMSSTLGSVGGDSTPHSSRKLTKESKSSSKSHSHSSSGGASSSSSLSVSLGVTMPTPLSAPVNVKDADGNVVWICPACGRVDDGTPMIGCDGCDAWYHWVCVGIQVPPDSNEDWYCRVCIGKKQESHGDEKQRKRKKKDKKNPKD